MRRKTVLTFLAIALAGLAVRQLIDPSWTFKALFFDLLGYRDAGGPISQSALQEQILAEWNSSLYWWRTFWGPLLATGLVAAVAGYVSPRRFWLWGLAAFCLRPVEGIPLLLLAARYGGDRLIGIFAFGEMMDFVVLAVLCMTGAGVGAGLRLRVGRILRRPEEGANPDTDREARSSLGGPEATSPSRVPGETPGAEEFDISEQPIRSFARTLRGVLLLRPTDFFRGVAPRGSLTNSLVFALVCLLIPFVLASILGLLLGGFKTR